MTFSLEDFKERILGFEKNFIRFVIDPLHGQIGLTKLEDEVVKTEAFTRLKKIQQLGFVSNIYPGATHKRYEHCIGTLHVTWTMLKRFIKNYVSPPRYWYNEEVLNFFSDEVLESIRLAALLHDIGHGPFSHSFEQVAKNLGQKVNHDEITNYLLTYKFPTESIEELFPDREILRALQKSDRIRFFRKELKIIPRKTREAIIGIYNRNYKIRLSKPKGFDRIRLFLNNILRGDIGSDRIDYLLRDTYFSGLGHRFNFSDLLENLRGMYDEKSDRLLLAVDSKGRSIVEFLMMTRYYHYKLIAHHPRNVLEEIRFQERIKRASKNTKKPNFFFAASMDDDCIERSLPDFEKDLEIVGIWNMGTIGNDRYRFFFYRIACDPLLRREYAKEIKNNIVRGVNKEKKSKIKDNDIFLAFVPEKPHIPILQIYKPIYLIKKDVLEKYSVLLHDYSILIRGLARTYLEDASLLVFATKGCHNTVSEFTQSTHHFYLNEPLFKNCMSSIHTFKSNRYDFLLYALYRIMKGGRDPFNEGVTELFNKIHEFHEKHKLDFYDFDSKDVYDPDFGPFCYPKVVGREESLMDDLFLFDAAGLIEIKIHLANKVHQDKKYYSDSYFFVPTKRYREIGLSNPMIPLKSTLRIYPDRFIDTYELHDIWLKSD